MADVPPWHAYIYIAFLNESTEGALRRRGRGAYDGKQYDGRRLGERLLVHWHLDGDVRQVRVHDLVRRNASFRGNARSVLD